MEELHREEQSKSWKVVLSVPPAFQIQVTSFLEADYPLGSVGW
jgi:hypothetical protein